MKGVPLMCSYNKLRETFLDNIGASILFVLYCFYHCKIDNEFPNLKAPLDFFCRMENNP